MLIRIAVGVTLALFFLAVLYFGGVVQCIAFSLATFLCAYELINALKQKGIKPFSIPIYIFSISYYAVFKYIGMYWMLLLFIC